MRRTKLELHADDPRWRPDINPATGQRAWSRFRGRGRRGRQSPAITDAADLGAAMRTLATATESLVKAHGRVIPSQRRADIAAAVGMLGLVTRMLDEVIARRGGALSDCLADLEGERE